MDNLARPYSADIFIHTWSKTGNTNKLILLLPRGFHLKLPYDYWHAQPDLLSNEQCMFEQKFPITYKKLQYIAEADEDVTRSELVGKYAPTNVVIEDFDSKFFEAHLDIGALQLALSDTAAFNAAPMFYKISACDKLRIAHERRMGWRYDCVIRTRPDMAFAGFVDLKAINFQEKVSTLHNPFYDVLNINETHSNDMFFAGSSEAMTYASGLWEELPRYWDPSFDPQLSLGNRGPELLLNRHLRARNLLGSILRLERPPYRVAAGIDFPTLIELLKQDYRALRQVPHFVTECVGICQSIYAVELCALGQADRAEALLSSPIMIDDMICVEPFAGRAKMANIKGDACEASRWARLAKAAGQEQAFPELFAE